MRSLRKENTGGKALVEGFLLPTVFFGSITDILSSRRTSFILGLIVLFLSTLFFALATSVWALLIARILEGLSTAIVCTVGYTLLTEVVGLEHLGKAMGYTSMALSFGLMIGPVIGGVLYEYCGYFQVFLPAFGLIAIEAFLRLMIVEKEKPISLAASSESASLSTETTSKASSVDANVDHPSSNIIPSESELLLRQETIMQPANAYAALLTSPRFLVALTALFVLNSIANGFDSTLVPYIQDAFDMHSTHAAALFLALAVPMLLAPLSGWLTDRYGPRIPITAGLSLAIPSLSLLSLVSRDTSMPFLKLAILLACVGLTFALCMAPLRVEANLVVDRMEKEKPGIFGPNGALGRAIGLLNGIVSAGAFVGPLGAGFVRVAAGWEVLAMLNGAVCVVILALFLVTASGKGKEVEWTEEAEV